MKKLFLVDVSSIFFRAFFALPPLTNSQGMPTNALYGFLSMVLKLLRDSKPDYLVFCFDTKEPSFRNEMYPEYKANREEMPADLVPQIPYVKKLTQFLGIPSIEMPGFEADDLIGTLTSVGIKHHCQVVIVSGDKDFAQLVGPQVAMWDTMKDITYDVEGVYSKWGVRPDQMIDYLALVGDSSDNIPGVSGIGPKGAQKLLSQYETLEGVYSHLDEISGKAMKEKLIQGKESAFLSKKLVSIHRDISLPTKVEDYRPQPMDRDKLKALLLELGFNTFARKLLGDGAEVLDGSLAGSSQINYSNPVADNIPSANPNSDPASVNIESPQSKSRRERRLGSTLVEQEWTIEDVRKQVPPYEEIWLILHERGSLLHCGHTVARLMGDPEEFGKVLSEKLVRWFSFDLKETWKQFRPKNPQPGWDSMLASYVLRPRAVGGFSEVYQEELNQTVPDLPTNSELVQMHLELRQNLLEKLGDAKSLSVLERFELPLVPVLYRMEQDGILIDSNELYRQSRDLSQEIKSLEAAIYDKSGGSFNIASPKQLAEVLFQRLKLTPSKKTKTGFSTDSDVLERLSAEHPVPGLVVEYRELAKLKSTYVDALPALVNPSTGRLHTHFNQAVTATGRLSSQNPNLQNIPIRTSKGREVRQAFIAKPGSRLVSADYSQIELRILAHVSEDPGLIRAFQSNQDIHLATASEVFGVDVSEVTEELRRRAKAVNFGIAYGQGAFGLAENLGIPRGDAAEIIARYFEKFSGVKRYMEETVRKAMEDGYVTTMFGRRRYLPELQSKSMAVRKFGERAAINAPIQGGASDLVKLAMIRIFDEIEWPMLLQVHDELVFEVDELAIEEATAQIQAIMEHVCEMRVPLKVNIRSGRNWNEAH